MGHVESIPPKPDAETTIVEEPPWQNDEDPLDTDDDGLVAPLDVLLIINYLNSEGAGPLPVSPVQPNVPPPFYDVNGDNLISAIDALLIVNFLNDRGRGGGEGESVVAPGVPVVLGGQQEHVSIIFPAHDESLAIRPYCRKKL